jgi:hypothetical protein
MARKYFTTYEEPRPVLVTLICFIGIALVLAEILSVIFSRSHSFALIIAYGRSYPIATIIIDLLTLIAYIGIWKMRLWGVLLFGITSVILAVYGFTINVEYWWSYLPAIIILIICIFHLKRMK